VGQVAQFEDGGHLVGFDFGHLFVEDGDAIADGAHFGDFCIADGGIFEGADFFGSGVAQALSCSTSNNKARRCSSKPSTASTNWGSTPARAKLAFDGVGLFAQ
jgi:hypothetical protein